MNAVQVLHSLLFVLIHGDKYVAVNVQLACATSNECMTFNGERQEREKRRDNKKKTKKHCCVYRNGVYRELKKKNTLK